MTTEEAVEAIRQASNRHVAATIRNDVALQAMRKQRPEADADACREAFHERWGEQLEREQMQRTIGPPITGYWGD